MVEHQAGREAQPGRGLEPVAQFDGGQRVEADLAEGPPGVDRRRVGVAEHPGGLLPDEGEQLAAAFGGGEGGQAAGQAGGLRGRAALLVERRAAPRAGRRSADRARSAT